MRGFETTTTNREKMLDSTSRLIEAQKKGEPDGEPGLGHPPHVSLFYSPFTARSNRPCWGRPYLALQHGQVASRAFLQRASVQAYKPDPTYPPAVLDSP